jgi:DNA-binding XRE family transcriptional regulator
MRRAVRAAVSKRFVFDGLGTVPEAYGPTVLAFDRGGESHATQLPLGPTPDEGLEAMKAAGLTKAERDGATVFYPMLLVGPLTVDDTARTAGWRFTLAITSSPWPTTPRELPFFGKPRPGHAEALWRWFDRWLSTGCPDWTTTTTTPPPPEKPEKPAIPKASKAADRVLFESPTRIDRKAGTLAEDLGQLQLPRSMARAKSWEALQAEFVRELQAEHVEGPERERLLAERSRRDGGRTAHLKEAGLRELQERMIGRHYVLNDKEGRPERLVKSVRLPRGGGILTCWLSFYGRADLCIEKVRESHIANSEKLAADLKRDMEGRLPAMRDGFDHSNTIERLERDIRWLRQANDAWRLLPKLLAELGKQRKLPLAIPDWELRHVLGAEAAVDGHYRVEAALEILRRLEVGYTLGPVKGAGGVVSWTEYEAAGPGRHGDGTWRIFLAEQAVGCLEVWRTLRTQLPSPKGAPKLYEERFDWSHDKAAEDGGGKASGRKKAKPTGLAYDRSETSLIPHYVQEAELTEAERRLMNWLPGQLTRNRDPMRKGRRRAAVGNDTADDYRRYDREFCPRLPEGRRFVAALGHDRKRAAELGWRLVQAETLRGKTGGGRPLGLLQRMGFDYPPGNADGKREKAVRDCVAAIRNLIEAKLGGVVAAEDKAGGRWLSSEEAAAEPATVQAKKLLWLLFLPEDWTDRIHATIETNSAKRGRPIRVTRDEAEKRAAEAYRRPKGAAAERDNPLGLWARLRTARKARKLKQADIGAVFGVSQAMVAKWERGTDPIRPGLVPLLEKWIEDETNPTREQLDEAR